MRGSRRRLGALVTAAALMVALAGAAPVDASFPGRTGLIAFTRSEADGTPQIWLMNGDGTAQRKLTRGPGAAARPRWSRDGSRLAYMCTLPGRQDQDICVMNDDGTRQRDVTSKSLAQEGMPAWSSGLPDRIVFQSNRGKADPNDNDIYVMNADGTHVAPVTSQSSRDEQPVWASGTDRVAFVQLTQFDDHELYTIDPSGYELVKLEPSLLPLNATDPDWSPDGRWIAFTGTIPGQPPQAYVVGSSGGNARALTFVPAANQLPRYSPDARAIVFISTRDAGIPHVFRMNADGSGVRQLTFGSSIEQAADWQPSPLTVPLRVAVQGGGRIVSRPTGVDCTAACVAHFEPGASVTLAASASGDARFDGWRGACRGRARTCRVSLGSGLQVGAVFRPLARVVVAVRGSGSVATLAPRAHVCASRCRALFDPGSAVVLTARARVDSAFASWGGACAGMGERCRLIAAGRTVVVARFVKRVASTLASARIAGGWKEGRFAGTLVVAG